MSPNDAACWSGPGAHARGRTKFTWNALLWALVFPQRRQQTLPTISGVLLIGLALGIGSAAYNSANNILFITLSLLLACLILSGVLALLNFRGVEWRLRVTPPLRVGQGAVVALELRNGKKFLPTYGLWFELTARVVDRGAPARAESTITAKGSDVRAALARAEQVEARERLYLRTRLDPAGEVRMEWGFKPGRRGLLRVELDSVGSLFPFGFLKKQLRAEWREDVVVWAPPAEYRRLAVASSQRPAAGARVARAGSGGDLLALRRYTAGDSHRLIHWKASARSRQLLVRQFTAESAEGFSLRVDTDAAIWPRAEQFELLVSFAGTLAEDLFRAGTLVSVALDAAPAAPVRRVRDLEAFLDRLALAEPAGSWAVGGVPAPRDKGSAGGGTRPTNKTGRKNLITFAPDGPRGVIALADGEKIAAA
jgi:uncharacterized protein (DUF58 family)